MKTIARISFLVLIGTYLPLKAQFGFNDLLVGFNKNLFFTDVEAKVMYKDGSIKEINTFYHPVYISNAKINLGEWKTLVGESYPENTIPKSDLKALYIDGGTWVPRTDISGKEYWARVTHWGAIERRIQFDHSESLKKKITEEMLAREVAKSMGAAYDENDIPIGPTKEFQKLDEPAISGGNIKVSFRKTMAELTADNKELAAKITNKEKGYRVFDLEGIIQEYNDWYDTQHPGAVSRITDEDWGIKQISAEEAKQALRDANPLNQIKKAKAGGKERYEAKKASRPTSAPAAIASVKPNVPVKKESFSDKVARIKADGNKIGIQFINPYVYIKQPTGSTGAMGMSLGAAPSVDNGFPKDTVVAYNELNALANSFVNDMNAAFDTDVFELVEDISQVPYRKAMGSFLIDDWWATKYKMLFTYTINSYYDISKAGGKYSGFFRTNTTVTGTEFFMNKGKPRQKIVAITSSMGNYYKELSESVDDNIKSIADIESNMNGKMEGEKIYDMLAQERKSSMEKFIAKRK